MAFGDGLRNLFGGGGVVGQAAAGTAQGVISAVGSAALDLRTAITGVSTLTAEQRAELEGKLADLEAAALQGQVDINKIEAASPRLFISGWRPAIGWCGALALFYNFIARPMLVALGVAAPEVDTAALWPVIIGMLGLGAYRTVEKSNGSVTLH